MGMRISFFHLSSFPWANISRAAILAALGTGQKTTGWRIILCFWNIGMGFFFVRASEVQSIWSQFLKNMMKQISAPKKIDNHSKINRWKTKFDFCNWNLPDLVWCFGDLWRYPRFTLFLFQNSKQSFIFGWLESMKKKHGKLNLNFKWKEVLKSEIF